MHTVAKSGRKPEISAQISDSRFIKDLIVVDMGEPGYLTFRSGTNIEVEIGAKVLLDLVEDLSKRKETLGFLLGHSNGKLASFVQYAHSDIPYVRSRSGLDYYMKDYVKELRGFRREGFDVQSDVHSHPYEDDYRIPIKHSLRGLPVSYLLKHGLFEELEKEGGLSKRDIRSVEKDHRRLEKKGVGFRKSFSGVLSRFHIKHIDADVKVLVLNKSSALGEPVWIGVV